MTEDKSTPPAVSGGGFRRHGKRNRVLLILFAVYLAFMGARLVARVLDAEDGPTVLIVVVVTLLICAAVIAVVVSAMSTWHRDRTEELAKTAPVAITMAPLGSFWADLRGAFRRPGEEGRALRTALAFTLTADASGLTLWKGGAAGPDRIAWIDWRDVVRIETADIADRVRRQPGVVVAVGTPAAPTELTMALCSDGPAFRYVSDRARILSAVRALEDQRLRALERYRPAGE